MNRPFVIAEIGINHNGDIQLAKRLIRSAKDNGFDAVKFQKRNPEKCVPVDMRDVMRSTPWGNITYFEYRNRVEFGRDEYDEIDRYCKQKNIPWFASVWDLDSLKFLEKYNLPYNKIGSPMMTCLPLLDAVAKEKKYTFIATGMSKLSDIDTAVEIFKKHKCPFLLMHSVGVYPCPESQLNIERIGLLKERYNCEIGYSGHEVGVLPTVLAVAEGAVAIERHITLDRSSWGTDQGASLEPGGQEMLVRDILSRRMYLGNRYYEFSNAEKEKAKQLRWW